MITIEPAKCCKLFHAERMRFLPAAVISELRLHGKRQASTRMAKTKPFRLLFVCMGNICRSPAAEIIFRRMAADAGLSDRVEVDSAGTIGFHAGTPPDPRMARTLKTRGYTVEGAARQVTAKDLEEYDLVLAMDDENYEALRSLAANSGEVAKIRKFVEFCSRHTERAVPDPYYGGPDGFERVADLVEDGCEGLLAHLPKNPA